MNRWLHERQASRATVNLKAIIQSRVSSVDILAKTQEVVYLDCSQSPYFFVGFSRLLSFDGSAVILVCKGERDLGRVSKLPRRAGVGVRWRQLHRSVPVSRIPQKNRGTVNSLWSTILCNFFVNSHNMLYVVLKRKKILLTIV